MWIRTGNVICNTDEFSRFYIEDIGNGSRGIFGKQSEEVSVLLGEYRDLRKAVEVFTEFYTALERGSNTFTIPKNDRWC